MHTYFVLFPMKPIKVKMLSDVFFINENKVIICVRIRLFISYILNFFLIR